MVFDHAHHGPSQGLSSLEGTNRRKNEMPRRDPNDSHFGWVRDVDQSILLAYITSVPMITHVIARRLNRLNPMLCKE